MLMKNLVVAFIVYVLGAPINTKYLKNLSTITKTNYMLLIFRKSTMLSIEMNSKSLSTKKKKKRL